MKRPTVAVTSVLLALVAVVGCQAASPPRVAPTAAAATVVAPAARISVWGEVPKECA